MKMKKVSLMLVLVILLSVFSSCKKTSPEVGRWKATMPINDMIGNLNFLENEIVNYLVTGGNGVDIYAEFEKEANDRIDDAYRKAIDEEVLTKVLYIN